MNTYIYIYIHIAAVLYVVIYSYVKILYVVLSCTSVCRRLRRAVLYVKLAYEPC